MVTSVFTTFLKGASRVSCLGRAFLEATEHNLVSIDLLLQLPDLATRLLEGLGHAPCQFYGLLLCRCVLLLQVAFCGKHKRAERKTGCPGPAEREERVRGARRRLVVDSRQWSAKLTVSCCVRFCSREDWTWAI